MKDWILIPLLTLGAGLAIPLGGFCSYFLIHKVSRPLKELIHFILAIGAGALLAAVALVLVPKSINHLNILSTTVFFLFGGGFFLTIDVILERSQAKASNLIAMLTDFIPEALSLGAIMASDNKAVAILLSLLIFIQNTPEGFNAFIEMKDQFKARTLLASFLALSLLGPLCGLAGYFFLSEHQLVVSGIMIFSSGGILYIIFQDIAPQVPLKKHWLPPMGSLVGFLLGLIGHMVIH